MGTSEMGGSALLAIAVAVMAVIGVAAVAALFVAKDDATVAPAAGPGVARAANADPRVAPGNVALLYSDERQTAALRAFATRIAGAPSAALEAAGQAVLVVRRPNLRVPVTAVTASRRLTASGARDPRLRRFVEYWLGRAP